MKETVEGVDILSLAYYAYRQLGLLGRLVYIGTKIYVALFFGKHEKVFYTSKS